MAQYGPKVQNSLEKDNPLTDSVTVNFTAPLALSSISTTAVDSNGVEVPLNDVSDGTAQVEILSTVNPFFETLKQQDNTTPVQLSYTAPETRVAFEAPLYAVRVTPTDLAGTGVAGFQVQVDQFR